MEYWKKIEGYRAMASVISSDYIPKKEQEMNYTKLTNQEIACNAIRGAQYVIGSIDSNGNFSISTNPVAHDTAIQARAECRRLAGLNPGKLFFFTKLGGAEYVPATQTISI